MPNHFLEGDRKTIKVGGVEIELLRRSRPNDEFFVWYPAGKVLLRATTSTRSFPADLYAIRGTPNRSTRLWAESLGKMADIDTTCLVGGHTNPIFGSDNVKQVLTDYRDAVQFIHDKTVEEIDRGLTPDELVEVPYSFQKNSPAKNTCNRSTDIRTGDRTTFNYYLAGSTAILPICFRCHPRQRPND